MKKFLINIFTRLIGFIVHNNMNKPAINLQRAEYDRLIAIMKDRTPKNQALNGYKVYSQNDEDGIIASIFERIKHASTFMEIGLTDGKECNTHFLLLNNWRGFWIEGDQKYVDKISADLNGLVFPDKLKVLREFVTLQNIVSLYQSAVEYFKVDQLDFFSIDIDGNDYYLVEQMLSEGCKPKVYCVEYNGKFPLPSRQKIAYRDNQVWDRTDYQGASLQYYLDLFAQHDYSLLCCSVVGVNAFFIDKGYENLFTMYSPDLLYQPARYSMSPIMLGSTASLGFLRDHLAGYK